MAYNPYTWGDTTPLVKSGYEDSYFHLLEQFPFNAIETRIVDGQYMTFFPKTYCKVSGKSGAGRYILFSHKKIDNDWKLMTCFHDFETGAEVENGVCHSRYIASKDNENKAASQPVTTIWESIPYTNIKVSAKTRGNGWLPLNIYDYNFRGLLMIIETLAMGYTGANCQTVIGGKDNGMGITHFGITNIWGGSDEGLRRGFWIYGIDTYNGVIDGVTISNTNLHIVDKSGVRRDTGLARSSSTYGYPDEFETKTVADQYDLNELLIGKNLNNGKPDFSNSSCKCMQSFSAGNASYTAWGSGTSSGPFYFGSANPSDTKWPLGFCLRKAV